KQEPGIPGSPTALPVAASHLDPGGNTEPEGAMHTDSDIQKDVLAELNAEPNLKNDVLTVGVRDGVVTLAGYVDSYADKWRAERVVSKVKGVKAVVNELEVKLSS